MSAAGPGHLVGMTANPDDAVTDPETAVCDHDWLLINRDENRLIYKCVKCGELRRE